MPRRMPDSAPRCREARRSARALGVTTASSGPGCRPHRRRSQSRAGLGPIAEVSIGFDSIEALEDALPPDVYRREQLSYEAAFLAGKAFLRYRQAGGARRSPLPDFYIGAHAAIAGYRLLTRDATRYRTCFPTLELIAPVT